MIPPRLSVIIPCRNEVRSIGGLLDDLAGQGVEPLTVVVADGMSDDGTWDLLRNRAEEARDPFVLVPVRNPDRAIPHGLNRAVEAAPDGIIIRLDAHGRIGPGYLRVIAAAIGGSRELLVGPRIVMVPGREAVVARVIAAVLDSRAGNGGTPSRCRIREPRRAGHAVMSCWHRAVWAGNGGFDESLLANEDFAFDWAARSRGCAVLALPEPVYRLAARATLPALARQRWRYGWWKAAVLRRSPSSLHARQLVPVLMLVAAPPLAVLAPWWLAGLALAWVGLVWAAVLPGAVRARSASIPAVLGLAPIVVAIVHFVWAAGLLAGLLGNLPGPPRPGARSGDLAACR